MVNRPGPAAIDPGGAPGGLVVCMYTLDGECLAEDCILPGDDIKTRATASAEFVDALLEPDEPFVIVVYDGDTGKRWGPEEWSTHGVLPGDSLGGLGR